MKNTTKKSISLYFVIIVVLIMFNCIQIVEYRRLKKSYNTNYRQCEIDKRLVQQLFFKNLDALVLNSDIFDTTIVSLSLSNKLVYVFGGNECEKCVFENIDIVKKQKYKDIISHFLVLPVSHDMRNAKIKAGADFRNLNFMILNPINVNFPIVDGNETRFFAVVNPENKILSVFIPHSDFPEITKSYINYVYDRYLLDCCQEEQ